MFSSRMIATFSPGVKRFSTPNAFAKRFLSQPGKPPLTQAEKEKVLEDAHRQMKGYVETSILFKQGKLKRRGRSEQLRSQNIMQISMLLSMLAAFVAAPYLGKKIAQDDEFREKYIPDWYDFRLKAPESAWTRQELHEQLVQVEREMRERALAGDFTPEKLEELKRDLQPRSDLSEEDLYYAEKYGWGKVHPGVDHDDYDEDDDDY
eukprot:Nitzschia sp. Nitz4//scaffold40_size135432//52097//52714//NITZ4_003240-RA/size135432-processed-gene-0.17-mRNA-1//1//CDS//3329551207//5132//frame0